MIYLFYTLSYVLIGYIIGHIIVFFSILNDIRILKNKYSNPQREIKNLRDKYEKFLKRGTSEILFNNGKDGKVTIDIVVVWYMILWPILIFFDILSGMYKFLGKLLKAIFAKLSKINVIEKLFLNLFDCNSSDKCNMKRNLKENLEKIKD